MRCGQGIKRMNFNIFFTFTRHLGFTAMQRSFGARPSQPINHTAGLRADKRNIIGAILHYGSRDIDVNVIVWSWVASTASI